MLNQEERIHTKRDLRDWLNYELGKYTGGLRFIPASECHILRKHQVLLRKTEYYLNTGRMLIGNIYRYRLLKVQTKYGLTIPLNVCGRGFKIMHIGPILINGRSTVGKDCTFHINTAIVAGGTTDDVPTLSDGIVVGVGAVILGGVFLAENIAVGANAVVNKSFSEPDIAIAGVPARKISNNGRTKWNKNKSK